MFTFKESLKLFPLLLIGMYLFCSRHVSLFDSADDKKSQFEGWKSRLAGTVYNGKSTPTSPGVSTAMDARLEGGIELAAELKVKVE